MPELEPLHYRGGLPNSTKVRAPIATPKLRCPAAEVTFLVNQSYPWLTTVIRPENNGCSRFCGSCGSAEALVIVGARADSGMREAIPGAGGAASRGRNRGQSVVAGLTF